MSYQQLPLLNATLNGITAILLSFAFYFIRQKKITAHRNCMIAAVICSTVFLASYLTYHIGYHGVTRFLKPPWFRPIYLTLLLTHTMLAATLPLVIITLNHALREKFDKHKKIARWTWPIWMYVSVTGVIIYLLLYQIFPQVQ